MRWYIRFYIYRISVVGRFLCRGDKRSSSTTDLLGRGVLAEATAGASLPLLLRLQIQGADCRGVLGGGEILIGQFVGVARVKDVCVIESTHGRINRPGAIIGATEGEIYK